MRSRRRTRRYPGGNGLAFDWRLIAGRDWAQALDAGGRLDAGQRGRSDPPDGRAQVDVSSGVEAAPGVKDAARMAAFVRRPARPSAPA